MVRRGRRRRTWWRWGFAHIISMSNRRRTAIPLSTRARWRSPFEWAVRFRFAGQDEKSEALWWRVTKDKRPQEFPKEFGHCAQQHFAAVRMNLGGAETEGSGKAG